MPSDTDARTVDRAIALKALILYLVSRKRRPVFKLEDIYNEHPLIKTQGYREICLNFTRYNTSNAVLEDEYESFRTAVQSVIDKKKPPIPPPFDAVARVAGITIPGYARSLGVPSFIDADAIPALTGSLEVMRPLVTQHEGCWFVYRVSTRRATQRPIVNVGFLNIKPYRVLVDEKATVPEFALYQRSGHPDDEEDGIFASDPSKTFGIFVHTAERPTLLGARARPGQGMSYIGLMMWRYTDLGQTGTAPRRPILGLSCLPNSEGDSIIGAYFCAQFLTGSNQLKGSDYIKLRQDMLGRIGPKYFENIKGDPTHATVIEEIQGIIKKSEEDRVFQI